MEDFELDMAYDLGMEIVMWTVSKFGGGGAVAVAL